MSEGPDLVQFLHPGGEHSKSSSQKWNTGKHQRKFMKVDGKYLESLDSYDDQKSDSIVFWGEWEPPANHKDSFPEGDEKEPNHLFSTNVCQEKIKEQKQNKSLDQRKDTDPFVFGDQFLYSICQQNTTNGPTHLQELVEGSVILFGSHKDNSFILDTVFVVAESITHTAENYAQKIIETVEIQEPFNVPDIYCDVVLDPAYSENGDSCFSSTSRGSCEGNHSNGIQYTLFFGATPENPVNGMFSFFPSKIFESDSSVKFKRPEIDQDVITGISEGMPQGYKYNFDGVRGEEDLYEAWKRVVAKVLDCDLKIGVHAECPTNTR